MDISSNSIQLLLIGGSSGTGKTVLARALSQRWGIPALQVDDFRLLLRRVIEESQRKGASPNLWDQLGARPIIDTVDLFTGSSASPERMAEGLKAVAEVMSDALEIVIAHHIATRTPVILEGDGLLPSLAIRSPIDNLNPVPGQLRAVFLVEDEEDRLFANAAQRGRGFETGSIEDQRRIIRANWLYGQWIREEANHLSLPILPPQPWDTLLERTLRVLETK